jgi:hypothetical protein
MHYSTDVEDIKSAIEQHGHSVTNIFNIKQQRSNIPLSLFFVDLKPHETNKDIYQLETLNYTKVRFEPPRPKRNLPQCGTCQRYGHTHAYCHHSPRCVKCAGNHLTKLCPRKEKSENVKCVLCDGNHPANYKGCSVYKEIQQRTFPPLRNRPVTKPSVTQPHLTTSPSTSYSTALKSQPPPHESATEHPSLVSTPQTPNNPPTSEILEIKNIMKGLTEQISTLIHLLTTVISKLI